MGMMLPAVKADLGLHCFGYAYVVSREFNHGGKGRPRDQLRLLSTSTPVDEYTSLRVNINRDWDQVEKGEDGSVSLEAFTQYFLRKNTRYLVDESRTPYEKFLQ